MQVNLLFVLAAILSVCVIGLEVTFNYDCNAHFTFVGEGGSVVHNYLTIKGDAVYTASQRWFNSDGNFAGGMIYRCDKKNEMGKCLTISYVGAFCSDPDYEGRIEAIPPARFEYDTAVQETTSCPSGHFCTKYCKDSVCYVATEEDVVLRKIRSDHVDFEYNWQEPATSMDVYSFKDLCGERSPEAPVDALCVEFKYDCNAYFTHEEPEVHDYFVMKNRRVLMASEYYPGGFMVFRCDKRNEEGLCKSIIYDNGECDPKHSNEGVENIPPAQFRYDTATKDQTYCPSGKTCTKYCKSGKTCCYVATEDNVLVNKLIDGRVDITYNWKSVTSMDVYALKDTCGPLDAPVGICGTDPVPKPEDPSAASKAKSVFVVVLVALVICLF